jgi:hypothetical protein
VRIQAIYRANLSFSGLWLGFGTHLNNKVKIENSFPQKYCVGYFLKLKKQYYEFSKRK